ncbi:hypothetical protein HaLaN_17422 [Haematococcus lacustris]|uniref:Uncharacterized protein n=1 Tax=Haematococcus lacustris TaxID=44745 RepID=A0A699ZL64_HAELA|nr:hypothetical protein HaLaN_17422 [Haematococcus lacustris]
MVEWFEFYELLVRLALARHVLTHTVPDTAEALQVLTQELQIMCPQV